MKSLGRKHILGMTALMGVLIFLCGSIRAQSVTYNFAPGTDFSKYHTYKWVTIDGAKYPDQIKLDMPYRASVIFPDRTSTDSSSK